MASYFLDSSVVVKRYHQEAGSEWVRAVCKRSAHSALYVADIAEVEVTGALYRAANLFGLDVAWAHATSNQFLRHLRTEYRVAALSPGVLAAATLLCRVYWTPSPLWSLDAMQLASAWVVRMHDASVTFVTANTDLEDIARQEGFAVLNPMHL